MQETNNSTYRALPDGCPKRPYSSLCLISLLLLCIPSLSFAITEAQFIAKVLAQDNLLEEAQIGLDIKQIELDASWGKHRNWKANLFIETDYRYQDLDRSTSSSSLYVKTNKRNRSEIGIRLEKRFLSNPGSLDIGISRRNDNTRAERYRKYQPDPDSDYELQGYTTEHYVQFNYPLLKHDSNATSLKTYRRDIIDFKRQKLLFYEIKENFLNDRLNDYLLWMLYHRQAQIEREHLHELRALNPRDETEAALLQNAIYQVEEYYDNIRNRLDGTQQKLAVLLDDETILSAIPEFDLSKRVVPITDVLLDYLKAHSRALERTTLGMQLTQINIEYYNNQKLPALDFTLKTEEILRNGNTISTRYADDRTSYEIGLEFNYELGGNISDRANLTKSLLGIRKLEISYQEQLQELQADLKLLDSLLELNEKQVSKVIVAANQSVDLERENYLSGKTSIHDLLQAYREQRIAKMDYIEKIIAYQMNRIQYDNLLDRIIATPCPATLSECEF